MLSGRGRGIGRLTPGGGVLRPRPDSSLSPDLLQEGLLEDRYKFTKSVGLLGRGSFSVVRVGESLEHGKSVAIKVVDKAKLAASFVQNEVEAMRRYGAHPNLLRLLDVYETANSFQLVLEKAEGGDLFKAVVGRGYLYEWEASKVVNDVCSALRFLHLKGIVHRDMKPENLLIEDRESLRVKLSDFGLAKVFRLSVSP